jgi:hypothetical protein
MRPDHDFLLHHQIAEGGSGDKYASINGRLRRADQRLEARSGWLGRPGELSGDKGAVVGSNRLRPGARPVAASAPPYLDLSALPQYIAATCCRPALTDIRRGFEFPRIIEPVWRLISQDRGLGAGGLFGFLYSQVSSHDGRGP